MDQWLSRFELVFYGCGAAAFLLAIARYFYNWFADYHNATAMTREIAYTHLPFIYNALKLIGRKLDVEIGDAPVISMSKSLTPLLRKFPQAKTPH